MLNYLKMQLMGLTVAALRTYQRSASIGLNDLRDSDTEKLLF